MVPLKERAGMSLLSALRNILGNRSTGNRTEVARFVTIGEPVSISSDGISDHHFEGIQLPGLLVGSGVRHVFLIRTQHAGEVGFQARLNNEVLLREVFIENGAESWHRTISPATLQPSDNVLTLSITGTGQVNFSDMVILYKSNATTIIEPIVVSG